MVAEASELVTLVGSLYDTVVDPALWTDALRRMSQNVNALGIALYLVDASGRKVLFRAAYNQPHEKHPQRVCDELLLSDEVKTSVSETVALYPPGRALRCTFRASLEDNAATGRYLIARFWLRVAKRRADPLGTALEIATEQEDVTSMWHVLEPHVRRALRLRQGLVEQMEVTAASVDVIEALSVGLLILDGRGSVRHMNQPAKKHLARGTGLVVTNDGTVATSRECDQQTFAHLLAGALADTPAAGSMALSRPDGPHPHVLQVLPFIFYAKTRARERVAALLIREPWTGADLPLADLQQLFGFTEREAELASLIVQGQNLTDSAERLGITVKTARHYLEAIFRKTSTRRQAQLIALLRGFTLSWSGQADGARDADL